MVEPEYGVESSNLNITHVAQLSHVEVIAVVNVFNRTKRCCGVFNCLAFPNFAGGKILIVIVWIFRVFIEHMQNQPYHIFSDFVDVPVESLSFVDKAFLSDSAQF